MPASPIKFGPWTIEFDPPPIPTRTMDWGFSHEDFDASWEGEEDGYVSNGLAGRGASAEDCKAQIADIEADRDMPSTAEAIAKAKAEATTLAVSTFAGCRASIHDGSTRGCFCGEIAGRLIARTALAQAEAAA